MTDVLLMVVEDPKVSAKSIFVVTVFGKVVDGRPRQRTWGWYEKADDAKRAVFENHTDMYETLYYDWAVIEEVHEGILSENRPRWWYRATESDGEGNDSWLYPVVTEVETPDWAKQTFGWGVG